MLRINLLPPYIFDDQKKRNVMVLWGSLTAGAAVAGVLWINTAKAAAEKADEDNKTATNFQTEYSSKETEIKGVKDAVAEIKSRQEFVQNAVAYNGAWAKMYEDVRNLTSAQVVLDKMVLTSPTTLELTGFAPTELDVARWWVELRKSELFDKVNFDLPPHPYPPAANGGAAASPMTASMSGGGNPMAGGMMSGGGNPMAGGMMSGMAPGMGGGAAGAAGGGKAGAGMLEGRPGLIFTARLALRKPFADGKTAPVWGSAGAGGGGGAGGGMPGGMSGMMSGMSMGGPGGGSSGSGGGGGAATVGGRKGTEE